ncbi:non-lysosomal glucosylceramidase-like [Lingula anatina]|uniref:Non-lysosomal glucosylceramidase-like n=1 Tax=Lingula anatina TaxID=7574 RepID=A0A1S3J636_LINAN|nr:non-lysosomal glucosylceramidase-like [Lingula anatina]|eukprot:XP_013405855.2 non-lysosomal glucosylceramidase-like [Lingula anatina]
MIVAFFSRYGLFWLKKRREGKRIFIDQVKVVPYQPIYGAPVGGIGCGTIGRGFRGEFCRFQMVPGIYQWHVVEANQFTVCVRRKGQTVYQQVLSPHRPKGPGLTAWNWAFHGEYATYHALYPRSWTTYDLPGQNIRLICRQVSPVFPHDYKDTSLPAAAFIWSIENQGSEPVDVSIMFTFKNGQGIREDKKGGVWNEPFESTHNATKVSGVMIHQTFKEMGCTYAVAASHREGVQVSHKVSFDPNSPAVNVWRDLLEDGELDSCPDPSPKTSRGQELATAVCAKCHVKPQSTQQMDFSLTWDMPVIYFGAKEQLYCRRYTRWFGSSGNASPHLASHTLNNYHIWEKKIDEWQKPIVQNRHLPDWYKSALFNELYFVSDGGTVWVDKMAHKNGFQDSKADTPPREEDSQKDVRDNPLEQEYGKFGYLEGQEYRMYNTYDVHYYASFALIMLWPKLQLSLQYDLAMDIPREDLTRFKFCMDGNVDVVKAKNCVPHDVGDPEDEPWIRTNCYAIHATHDWKDLNPKFVLQVYRDYHITKDHAYMKSMYPCAKAVTDSCLRFDHDGDGLIENGGFADQTYDSWSMTGASAYCGGLWLASLHLMCLMARQLGYYGDEKKYKEILDKGKISFERKLWNGM